MRLKLPCKHQFIVKLLIIFLIFFNVNMTFAYWANETTGSSDDSTGIVDIGDWWIPISTTMQFYEFATNTDSESNQVYYLENDLDFTSFSWVFDDSVIFKGTLYGNHYTIPNLTITVNSGNYLGIFPRTDGASIYDLAFENVHMETNFNSASLRSGLLIAQVNGGINTLDNISMSNCSIKGASGQGVGGLIGKVNKSESIVNISNIKVSNTKIYSTASNVGGLIGRVGNDGISVTMTDIDFQGEVFSETASAYTGGLIGQNNANQSTSIERVIIEATHQNTLINNSYYLAYGLRYIGGFIGYNKNNAGYFSVSNAIYMGSLFNNQNNRRHMVGTVSGRFVTPSILNDVYYSFVEFRSGSGTVIYSPDTALTGELATLVDDDNYPSEMWWDSFFVDFVYTNSLWLQDGTGRPYLNI